MKAARFRCMCGSVHVLPMERVLDALGIAKWSCTDCRRVFVLTHDGNGTIVPVFVDAQVRVTEVRETGSDSGNAPRLPAPPPAIDFPCRCGGMVTAHSWNYAGSVVCPHCHTSIYAALKYNTKKGIHVIVASYPPPGAARPPVRVSRPGRA